MLLKLSALSKLYKNDAQRFIAETHYTYSAEVVTNAEYILDLESIEKEECIDGFYAICSNL